MATVDVKSEDKCMLCFQACSSTSKSGTLSCGHQFCPSCLKSCVAADIIVCPTCFTKHPYPLEVAADKKDNDTEYPEEGEIPHKTKDNLHEIKTKLVERKKTYIERFVQLKEICDQSAQLAEILKEQAMDVDTFLKKGLQEKKSLEESVCSLNAARSEEEIFTSIAKADHYSDSIMNFNQDLKLKVPILKALMERVTEFSRKYKDIMDSP